MSHDLKGFACLNWCRISFHQQYGVVKFFFWGAFSRPRRSVSWTKVFVVSNTGPIRLSPEASPPRERLTGFLANNSLYVTVESLGSASSPQARKTSLKSNHAHFAAIFLYLSRKLLPFIIFTKDLILYAWMLSLLLALLPPKTNKKKEGQNIYRPAKAFQICKATDVVSKVQNRRQP